MHFFCHLLTSEMAAADSQMTTSFFMLRPVKGWETKHSQMTTGFFMLRPGTGWETNHSQMTTSFFMLQSWMLDTR